MKIIAMASAIALLLAGSAVAGGTDQPGGAALNACDLAAQGLAVANGNGCLSVTGGVAYSFAWGDYRPGVRRGGHHGERPHADGATTP